MAENSSIEWTDATWNPIAGCDEISPGCLHCYAAIMAHRLEAMANADITAGRSPGAKAKYIGTTKKLPSGKIAWTGKLNTDEEALSIPLKTKKPTKYFVNSMSDLFHKDVPDAFIDKTFGVMALTPRHIYQVLTKRADRLPTYCDPNSKNHSVHLRVAMAAMEWPEHLSACIRENAAKSDDPEWYVNSGEHAGRWPLPNVWLGVSVENRQHGLPRIEHLRRSLATVRWLSIEPLLEDLGVIDLTGIHWVVVGGESGHGARPCRLEWIRSIRDQCKEAGVPCFIKQLGSNPIDEEHFAKASAWFKDHWGFAPSLAGQIKECTFRLKDSKGGDISEWPEDLKVRQYPKEVTA